MSRSRRLGVIAGLLAWGCVLPATAAVAAPTPEPRPTPATTSAPVQPTPARPAPPQGALPRAPYLAAAPSVPAAVSALPPQIETAGGLDPRLQAAWEKLVPAAREAGFALELTSGYRSVADQERIWEEGLVLYGSPEAARKIVAAPWESAHVRGLALDIGPDDAARAWIEAHQEQFGLCRRYANETWHFELKRPEWQTCPPMLASASAYAI